MKPITEEFVEQIWHEVADYNPEQASKEMIKTGKAQPDLIAFMVEFTDDLDQEAKELALYLFFTIHRMFQKSHRKKIKPITAEEIISCYEQNEELMMSLEGVHDKFLDRIARIQLSKQPYVMKYVLEAFFERPDDEDPPALAEEDIGYLFLLLKTVIDLLDKATDT